MSFNLTTQLTEIMDEVTVNYIAETSSNVITFVTPLMGIAMTMALMIRGVMSAMSDGPPLIDHVRAYMFFALIAAIASIGGIYQTTIAGMIVSIPDAFASAVMGPIGLEGGSMANVVDQAMNHGLEALKMVWDTMSWDIAASLEALFIGALIILSTIVMCAVGFALLLVSKFMLGVLAAFGPAFIFLLVFQSTKGIADKWIGMVVNYGAVVVILSSVFGLIMSIFTNILSQISAGSENLTALSVSALFFTVVGLFVLFEVRGLAQSIGAGAGIALVSSMRNAAAAGRGVSSLSGGGGGSSSGGGSGAGGGGAPGVGRAANDATGGMANRVAGAFRGTRR